MDGIHLYANQGQALHLGLDLFARWRIADPLQYFLRLHDERSAQSRLDDILGSETRNAVAKHELIEIIRTTKNCVPLRDTLLTGAVRSRIWSLVPIQKGRKLVEQEIFAEAAQKVRVFGIELLDIRFKRINYNDKRQSSKIYDRMISERRQIAERFLLKENGEAARIRGNRVRDLNKIQLKPTVWLRRSAAWRTQRPPKSTRGLTTRNPRR